jgi:protein-disulfide isomerase
MSGGGNSDQKLVDNIQQGTQDLPLDMASGNKLGKDDAPIKLTTFVDFQCPFCLQFTANTEPTLIKEYVKTGKMQIIVQPFPILGAESVTAAQAGECAAGQNKFWPYYEKLYLVEAKAGQVSSEKQNAGRFSNDNLVNYAGDVGLDKAKLSQCLNSGKFVSAVQDSNNQAKSFGITATPGFLVNGTPLSGTPATLDDWRKTLDDILSGKTTPVTNGSATATTPASTATAPAATPSAAASATTTP